MKQLALALMTSVASLSIHAQNLIPNPSFEEYLDCPSQLGEIHFANNWSSFRLTPDYFNACSQDLSAGVPVNEFSTMTLAHDGDAYAGFGLTFLPLGYSELLGVELEEQLTIGEKYYISFHVRRGLPPSSNCWSNRIGARFSTVAYQDWPLDVSMPIFDETHIEHDGLIESTEVWTQISGYFTADSAYNFLAIGNHYNPDSITIFCDDEYFSYQAYYFVDAVCVSLNPEDCEITLHVEKPKKVDSKVFPNPTREGATLILANNELVHHLGLYNLQGKLIEQFENTQRQSPFQFSIPEHYSTGMYFIQGLTTNGDHFSQTIFKTN